MKWITLLGLLAVSGAQGAWMSEIPNAPPRWKSKLFDIPTWIIPIEDYDNDTFNAVTVFSVVTMGFATAYALYDIIVNYLPSQSTGRRTIGRFNRLILGYLLSTFVASFSFMFMNAGRIWASFGVFHNLFEIALLTGILIRRSTTSDLLFVPVCFGYLLLTSFVVICAPWPLDALFFKFQGLTTDFALGIDLIRLYWHNYTISSKVTMVTVIQDPNDDGVNDGIDAGIFERPRTGESRGKLYRMAPVHVNLLVIAVAANLHTFGNALVTVSNNFLMWVIFQFMYAVSFPMYAYYIVAEPNSSRVSFYKVDYVKEILVGIVGVGVCGLCIVGGIINGGIEH